MKWLFLSVAVSALVFATPAHAPSMGEAQLSEAQFRAASAFSLFFRNAPVKVMTFLLRQHPDVFRSIDREAADTCLSSQTPAAKVDVACNAVLQQFIATIRSLLSTSYGLTRSMGRFDPTTVSYSRELTRRLLMLDPQRKI